MKALRLMVFNALLSVLVCACASTTNDEQQVKDVVKDFVEDFNDGTFRRAESYATTHWQHINPLGGVEDGKVATLKSVRGVHQAFLKNVSMTTDSLRVNFVAPGVAVVLAYHTMDTYTTPDNVQHLNERHVKTYVVVKQDGRWLLALDHNTIVGGGR